MINTWNNSQCVHVADKANSSNKLYSGATAGILKQSGLGASVSFAASGDTKVTLAWTKGTGTFIPDNQIRDNISKTDELPTGAVVKNASFKRYNVDNDAIGLGVETDLGGGATLQAGIAKVNDDTKVSAGISMSF